MRMSAKGSAVFFHSSSPFCRDSIAKEGLKPRTEGGCCGENENSREAVYLSKNQPFDSGYDDDIYIVSSVDEDLLIRDPMCVGGEPRWFKSFDPIPLGRLTLIYQGTGEYIG